MSRKRRGIEEAPRPIQGKLADRLAEEIRENRESGQPMIDEQLFPSDKICVTVIWDEWDPLSLEDRTATILRAYEQAEGRPYREKITLASGLTLPEAVGAGMLPYQVIPALRRGDPVTLEECRQAMIDEGASLLSSDKPQLRFAMEDEAVAAIARLVRRLPKSDQVWVVTQEIAKVEDWRG